MHGFQNNTLQLIVSRVWIFLSHVSLMHVGISVYRFAPFHGFMQSISRLYNTFLNIHICIYWTENEVYFRRYYDQRIWTSKKCHVTCLISAERWHFHNATHINTLHNASIHNRTNKMNKIVKLRPAKYSHCRVPCVQCPVCDGIRGVYGRLFINMKMDFVRVSKRI